MSSIIISIIIALLLRIMPDKERKKIIRGIIIGLGWSMVGAALTWLIMSLILLKG